jgi:uridylate kinase
MLLKISDTNGIYTADPSKNPRAKLIRSITYSDLIRLLNKQQQLRIAGTYDVFDIGAAKILERANIDTVYFNGKDNSKNIFSALNRTIGTKISKYPA